MVFIRGCQGKLTLIMYKKFSLDLHKTFGGNKDDDELDK